MFIIPPGMAKIACKILASQSHKAFNPFKIAPGIPRIAFNNFLSHSIILSNHPRPVPAAVVAPLPARVPAPANSPAPVSEPVPGISPIPREPAPTSGTAGLATPVPALILFNSLN
ncbi:Uncharacterised protein [Streptococcus pneumoniae]|nr:Uncharacterised protein [Streptococcus pneumoniae]